jgi:hypothetical protein
MKRARNLRYYQLRLDEAGLDGAEFDNPTEGDEGAVRRCVVSRGSR